MVHAIYGIKKAPSNKKCIKCLTCSKKKNSSILSDETSRSGAEFHSSFTHMADKSRLRVSTNPDIDAHIEKGTIFESSGIIDQAYDSIRGSLDLATICREIDAVRYLASFFVKNYQKGLIPLVALSNTLQENNISKSKSNAVCRAMRHFASDFQLEKQEDYIIKGVKNLLKRMEEIKNEENKCGSGKHMSYALDSPLKGGINSEAQSTTRTRSLASKDLEMEINNNYLEELAKVPSFIGIKSLIPDISIPRSDLDFSYQPKDISSAPAKKPPTEEMPIVMSPPQHISNSAPRKIKKRLKLRTINLEELSVEQQINLFV